MIRFLFFLILCFSFLVSFFVPGQASLLTAKESFNLSFHVVSKDNLILIKEEAIGSSNTEKTNYTQNIEQNAKGTDEYSNLVDTVDTSFETIPEVSPLNEEFNTEKTEPNNDFDIEIRRRIFFKDTGNVPKLSISVKNNGFSSVYIFAVIGTTNVNSAINENNVSFTDGINEEDWTKLQDNIYYYGDSEYLWDFYEGCESKLFEMQFNEENPEISIYVTEMYKYDKMLPYEVWQCVTGSALCIRDNTR